jgi:AraC family transcriptional regulator, transcriptional activator of pobA
MIKDRFGNIGNNSLVSDYGKLLRKKASGKIIVDFDENLKMDFDIQLHRIEKLVNEFEGFMPPNRMSHYILAFITVGKGQKTIGQYSFNIQNDMTLIFPRKVIHSTNTWSLDTKGFMLTFNDNFFTGSNFPFSFLSLNSLFKLSHLPYRIVAKDIASRITSIYEDLFLLDKSGIHYKSELLTVKVAELIFIYKSVFETENLNSGSKDFLYDKFVDLVERDFRKEKSVKYYADILSVHPNHLNFIVKKHAGYTAKGYILNRLILEAKYILTSPGLPVKEIAFDLGFEDYNYFCRSFKTIVKLSPQKYRESFI